MSPRKASAIRSIVRAAVVLITAFGLELSAEQVGAIQLAVEAALQGFVEWGSRES